MAFPWLDVEYYIHLCFSRWKHISAWPSTVCRRSRPPRTRKPLSHIYRLLAVLRLGLVILP